MTNVLGKNAHHYFLRPQSCLMRTKNRSHIRIRSWIISQQISDQISVDLRSDLGRPWIRSWNVSEDERKEEEVLSQPILSFGVRLVRRRSTSSSSSSSQSSSLPLITTTITIIIFVVEIMFQRTRLNPGRQLDTLATKKHKQSNNNSG